MWHILSAFFAMFTEKYSVPILENVVLVMNNITYLKKHNVIWIIYWTGVEKNIQILTA